MRRIQPCIDPAIFNTQPKNLCSVIMPSFRKAIPGISAVTSRLSFIDILEDGNLDFFFHMQMTDPSGVKYMTLQAVYNNLDYDAFFLTISILTSKYEQDSLFNNTEYIGGVASFFVTMLSGELAPKTANQLAQAGSTLQLPYIRQGLGRTNNYLLDLTITVPRNVQCFIFSHILSSSGVQSSQTLTSLLFLQSTAPKPQNGPCKSSSNLPKK